MKHLLLLLSIFSSQICASQDIEVYTKDISIICKAKKSGDSIYYQIKLNNLGKQTVFIPCLDSIMSKILQHEFYAEDSIFYIRIGKNSRNRGIPIEFRTILLAISPGGDVEFSTSKKYINASHIQINLDYILEEDFLGWDKAHKLYSNCKYPFDSSIYFEKHRFIRCFAK